KSGGGSYLIFGASRGSRGCGMFALRLPQLVHVLHEFPGQRMIIPKLFARNGKRFAFERLGLIHLPVRRQRPTIIEYRHKHTWMLDASRGPPSLDGLAKMRLSLFPPTRVV